MADATLTLTLAAAPADRRHPRVTLTAGSRTVTLPSTAPESPMTNLGPEWKEQARPGLKPLLLRGSGRLSKMTLDVLADERSMGVSVEDVVAQLLALAEEPESIICAYGPLSAQPFVVGQGGWRMADLEVKPAIRREGTNEVITADLTISLVEASDFDAPKAGATRPAPASRRHTVTAGETVQSIAASVYGSADAFRAILEANGIRDASKVATGMVLNLP